MESCFKKASTDSKVTCITWHCTIQNYKQNIYVTGSDLRCLQQEWEATTVTECWLNDNVKSNKYF